MSEYNESVEPGHSNPEMHLRQDGQPDHRFKEHGGGSHGNQGGRETGFEEIGDGTSQMRTEGTGEDTGTYKPSEHGGRTRGGDKDQRVDSEHGFGGDRERASAAGQKGGAASYDHDGLSH
ncbi:hypothetical protein EHS25_002150 [Saitozyma podzolica]|uniref:Uncharacterized protein n=1 Tax=Saitozyma podzolica TaxID=1890683 RepID=A0A427YEJ7_9TREE|nr:hypothetical protein EHS25_002150 [Saitozyma podzolica]